MWSISSTVAIQQYFTDKYRRTVDKDFKVEVSKIPAGTSHRSKLITAASAGQLPDILDDSMAYGSDLATYNVFEPINITTDYGSEHNLYERVWDWFNTENIPGFEGESHIFGVPYGILVFTPTYRADLFRENNVEFPTTWDELITAGQALTDAPNRYALALPTSGDLVDEFHPYLVQAGARYVNEDLTEGFPDREAAYEAFSFYSELVNTHKIAPLNTPDRFSTDTAQQLTSGQILVTNMMSVTVGALREAIGNDFGEGKKIQVGKFWAGPAGPGGYYNAIGLMMKRGIENPGPVMDYAEWLLEPEQQAEVYTMFNNPPINTSVWDQFADDPTFVVMRDSIETSERQGGFRGWNLAALAVDRAVERIVLDGEPVDRVVDQCATDMVQALANA